MAGWLAWGLASSLLGVHVVLAWLARQPGIHTGHDDAVYVALSRALRELHYVELFHVGTPFHRQYPPGYPALLAIWSAIGGEGYNWLVTLSILCSAAGLALTFSALRRLWGASVALAGLAALATNPALIDVAGKLVSEPPFIFFEALALWALTRGTGHAGFAVLAGGAGIGAAITRSAGTTLVLAIGVYWLWKRRYRAVATFGIASVLTVGVWLGWTALAPVQITGHSYIADALSVPEESTLDAEIVSRVTEKVDYVPELYWLLPAPTMAETRIDNAVGLPVFGVGLLFGAVLLGGTWPPAALYLVAYGGLLLVWPWPVGRFLVPLLPLIVPSFVAGIGRAAEWFRPRWFTPAAVATTGVLAVTGLVAVMPVVWERSMCDPAARLPARTCLSEEQASFFDAVRYVRDELPSDAVLLSGKPATIYHYAGRLTVERPLAGAQSADQFIPFLRQQRATHALLGVASPLSSSTIGPLLVANCDALRLEASFSTHAFLFRLRAPDEPSDRGDACATVRKFFGSADPARGVPVSGPTRLPD